MQSYSTQDILALFQQRHGRPINDPDEFYDFCGAERMRLFAEAHGGRRPQPIAELWSWLNATGSPWRE
jgi:hypothetical protein